MREEYFSSILLILLSLILVIVGVLVVDNGNEYRYEGRTHIVRSGDTLYGIAFEYIENPSSLDIREYVYELREFNGIGSTIHSGQEIKILEVVGREDK